MHPTDIQASNHQRRQDVETDVDLPIALRKQKRVSVVTTNTSEHARASPRQPFSRSMIPPPPSLTNTKKRSRHSEPISTTENSTDLTPYLKRTRIQSPAKPGTSARKSSKTSAACSHRRSLPANLDQVTTVLPSLEDAVHIQFAPLRQILSPRIRRRLKRSRLSEEMNTIEAQNREFKKQEQRIKQLEAELAAAKQEAERVPTASNAAESFRRVQELEGELQDCQDLLFTPPPISTDAINNQYFDMPSPALTLPFSDDERNADCEDQPAAINHHAAVQTEPMSPSVRSFQARFGTRNSFLVKARIELENIHPGETALPLQPSTQGDAAPLINAMLGHLRTAKSDLIRTKTSLDTISKQEQNLRTQFNASLANVDTARAQAKGLQDDVDKITRVFRASRRQVEDYHKQMKEVVAERGHKERKIQEMEKQADEYQLGIERLSNSLQGYFREVEEYKTMIMSMEADHEKTIERLKTEHLQAVKSLQEQAEVEANGRQDELDGVTLQLKQADYHRNELREAVHLKQRTLRDVEDRLEKEQIEREREVGVLNTRLATTMSRLHELEYELKASKRQACASVDMVVEQARKAGEDAMLEIVGEAGSRSFGGLMTPEVDGGRFVDALERRVEGRVEVHRGKAAKRRRRNPDSGIGILEEDETPMFSSDL